MIAAVMAVVGRNERMLRSDLSHLRLASKYRRSTSLSTAASSDNNHRARPPNDNNNDYREGKVARAGSSNCTAASWAESNRFLAFALTAGLRVDGGPQAEI